jgi:hypothetical protein
LIEFMWLCTNLLNGQSEVLHPAFVEIARIGRKRPVLWVKRWILHQENALSVRKFVSDKQVPICDHALTRHAYRPATIPLPTLKCTLKGIHFQSAEDIQKKR